ncbi:MAG: hypothetical protein JST26_13390 [Bacteroidetes bacterium]|nr:hypothetical protein [Bacteroidota bacterium]
MFSLYSCHRTKDLSENEIYSILNEIITDDSVVLGQAVCADFENMAWNSDFGRFLSADDIAFYEKQSLRFWKMKIKPGHLKYWYWESAARNKRVPYLPVDTLCSDTVYHSSFSLPIISADRQKVILKISRSGCFMCGSEETVLYEKIKDHWHKTHSWNLYIE